jgi:hypothetical protein
MPITARFTTSPQLLYRAQIAVLRNIKWTRWGGIFVVVVFPLFMLGTSLARGQDWREAFARNLAWIVGLPVFWLLGIPLAQRWGANRTFRTTPAARGDRTFRFDESEIVIEGGLSSGRLAWPAIVRIVETRELFLLFFSNQGAHFIPKSAFASDGDLEEFRALVRAKVSDPGR